ncbi:MAG: FAD-binding oxidoreductase [Pseudomonadota bacterium]
MTESKVLQDLVALVGADVALAPSATLLEKHTSDYCVQGRRDVGVMALVFPRSTEQVSQVLRYCNDHGIGVQPQGGLTGLAGGAVPVGPCVVVALDRMRAIKEIDVAAGTITVEAGVTMEAVQKAADAAELFYPLDLGGRGSCQIGGNVSTNAGGNRVLRYGMARDLVLGVEAVLADGTVIDALRKVIKNNSGYDLRQLFIGAEGTLGIVTQIVLRLFPKPRSNCTGICAVQDYAGVLELLRRARAGFGSLLSAYEVMWPDFYHMGTVGLGRKPPLELGHGAYVLIETLGTDPESDQARYESVIGEAIEAGVVQDAIIAQSQREATELWAVRDSPGEWSKGIHWPQLGFDVSVPTGEIGPLADEIGAELKRRWPELVSVFFGHVADGNLHVSVRMSGHSIPELDIEDAVYGIVAKRRGSISAEHGIGSLKIPFLHFSRSEAEIALMRAIKQAMDPKGIMNPGKLFASGPAKH